MSDTRVFKSEDGQHYTLALFLETSYDDTSKVLYTLKRDDYEYKGTVYKSFPKLFLEIADPTGYEVAQRLFDGWPHWQKIKASYKLAPVIKSLEDELEIKLRSAGVRRMIAMGKTSENAAKWLADKGWDKALGRPTKEKVAREAKKLQAIQSEVMSDAERLRNL